MNKEELSKEAIAIAEYNSMKDLDEEQDQLNKGVVVEDCLEQDQIDMIVEMNKENLIKNFAAMQEVIITQDRAVGNYKSKVEYLSKELDETEDRLLKANSEISRLTGLLRDIKEIAIDYAR